MSSNTVGLAGLKQEYEESGGFYTPESGQYTFKIVDFYDGGDGLTASMYLEVQGGPDAGKKWLTAFGSLSGNGAKMATDQWKLVGVTWEWIESLGTEDFATIVRAVQAALIGVVIQCSVAPNKKRPEYQNIVFNSLKLVSRGDLPIAAVALSGAPAAPSAAPSSAPAAVPTASAPATAPAAAPAPSGVPAAPSVEELQAQIAALQAGQSPPAVAPVSPPNGAGPPTGPAPAAAVPGEVVVSEDPGF